MKLAPGLIPTTRGGRVPPPWDPPAEPYPYHCRPPEVAR